MAWRGRAAILAAVSVILPICSMAQGIAEDMRGMQEVLDTLYDDMIPLCEELIGVGSGLAGFAALFYIAARVWRHLSNAEPIDFYPLFRPFVLGFCLLNFTLVLDMINGIMKPTVTGTAAMMEGSNQAIAQLLKQKEEAIKETDTWQMYVGQDKQGDRERWYKYTHDNADPAAEKWYETIGNDIKFSLAKASYRFKNSIKEWMSEVLRVLFEAAALCINSLRTFQLVVLAILGPFVFGIAVFDGFQHTLTAWIARYLNVYLWLPVCNIFGAIIAKIQENMLQVDLSQITETGNTFFSPTDTGYLIFLLIGIVGYFTVPTVASFIVNAGGGGMMQRAAGMMILAGSGAAMLGGAAIGRLGQGLDNMANFPGHIKEGLAGEHSGKGVVGAAGRVAGRSGAYLADKLRGK